MDAADIFRQGLGSVAPRLPQYLFPLKPPSFRQHPPHLLPDDALGGAEPHAPNRIAHTLVACCRCRQRKTRCDATLPRCLPCERSGSVCEYFDTTKGKKISRSYVVKLQEKVRELETELAHYFEEDNEYPRSNAEIMRPGGLVRLNKTDEILRYVGPSSGIGLTRVVMEEAKRYSASRKIADLIPEVRDRRISGMNRMQSVVSMNGSISASSGRKKSYPIISSFPAQNLPTRKIAGKLVEVFNQRAQVFFPTLHETILAQDLNAVFEGDQDVFKNFAVRIVMAISLQKLEAQYAGLADSYYLAAMQWFEDVIRPKNLRSLQCLALVAQYSTLTPTRTAVYYIVGLATRICQHLGLADEKTIAIGTQNAQTLDLRRRMAWIFMTMEYALAHTMGRPNGFARGDDFVSVDFFATVDDEFITQDGIQDGPTSSKKLVAVHFYKMHQLQAEIGRVLYERERPEPRNEDHLWFAQMQDKLAKWRESSPENPDWCKTWFTGHYYSMILFLHQPSPQIPKPSTRAAEKCFEAASYVIDLSSQQVKRAAIDLTWIFLLNLNSSLNVLLWTISYPEIRKAQPRQKVEQLVRTALEIIEQCSERWPGAASSSQLYLTFAKACMRSYDMREEPHSDRYVLSTSTEVNSPPPLHMSSPLATKQAIASKKQQQLPSYYPGDFGSAFNGTMEHVLNVFFTINEDHHAFGNNYPTFRSNSIFYNPGTNDVLGRRESNIPPELSPIGEQISPAPDLDDPTPPASATPQSHSSPEIRVVYSNQAPPTTPQELFKASLPTPPASLATSATGSASFSSPALGGMDIDYPVSAMPCASPGEGKATSSGGTIWVWGRDPPLGSVLNGPLAFPAENGLEISRDCMYPSANDHGGHPPMPLMAMTSAGFAETNMVDGFGCAAGAFGTTALPGGTYTAFAGHPMLVMPERQGSLSHEQQMELMDVLETEGPTKIDNYLSMGMGVNDGGGSHQNSDLARWA